MSALLATSSAANCRGVYIEGIPSIPLDACMGTEGVAMEQYTCINGTGYYQTFLLADDCDGTASTSITLEAFGAGALNVTANCGTSEADCSSMTATGYIDGTDTTSCTDEASGNSFTQSWITECYSYTSGGVDYSRQYTCDDGCPQQQSFDGDSCSGSNSTTQTVNLGSCILCDDSGDYCSDTSGAVEKMVSMVFAVVAGALWGTM